MNLEQIKIFIAVVDNRSFTKAAEALYISHSTTSRAVSALEAGLGVQLLERDSRGLALTEAGQVLLDQGRALVRQAEALETAVRSAGQGLSGRLGIASVNLYSYGLFNGYKDFCRQYPDVILGMYHRDIGDVAPLVLSGEADVGVTFSYALPAETASLTVLPVSTERFCVIAPVEYPIALRRSVTLSELGRMRYFSVPVTGFNFIRDPGKRELFVRVFRDFTVVPTLESLMLQIRSGNGISMVPYPIAYEYGSSCAILDIEDLDTSFDVVLIWRSENQNPILPLFIAALTKKLDYKKKA